ncbi:hypothetical protein B5S31_g3155 [[Candida] boidinii]|nr:hypothetical protein B5S31_g3155 [[Candida] boidinii]
MSNEESLLIGIDVGGTNTDSVLLNPSKFNDNETRGVISWNKSITTSDVADGIENAIEKLFSDLPKDSELSKKNVSAITIGTTHFINAVIEQDKARLEKIAVLRLCSVYSHSTEPFSDFPTGLKNILNGYTGFLSGGYYVNGDEINPVLEDEIKEHCAKIEKLGISSIAVVGLFAPMISDQEILAGNLIKKYLPNADIVLSHHIAGIGFLERENATILNAGIIKFAKKILTSFQNAMKVTGLDECPLLLTQNDGTVLSIEDAVNTPIKTFSSGATNSMRGASFLCSNSDSVQGKTSIVIDVGGTTSDIGCLLPTGFPRQSSSFSTVGGVRMNFSMPHVKSIGLGGGSRIRINKETSELSVGPDSVGSEIIKKAFVFGGDIPTATDLTIAQAFNDDEFTDMYNIGTPSNVKDIFSKKITDNYISTAKIMLEKVIDLMKTSADPLPVILVGGGAFIVPKSLEGASEVLHPPYYFVANAIGAAIGKISAESHTIKKLQPGASSQDKELVIDNLKKLARESAKEKGALEATIEIVDVVCDPIPYVNDTYQFAVKVIGDVDYKQIKTVFNNKKYSSDAFSLVANNSEKLIVHNEIIKDSDFKEENDLIKSETEVKYSDYKPKINSKNEWILSDVDLDFIRIGTYILGCGGGGTPYPQYLQAKNLLKQGKEIKVVDLKNIFNYIEEGDEGDIISVGFAGSPTVTSEQLQSNELIEAYNYLSKYLNKVPEMCFPLEIGGGNGFTGLITGCKLDIPCVDADLMGRAYPTHHQTIPVVVSDKPVYSPTVMSNGLTTSIYAITQNDFYVEKMLRASLAEIGCTVGVVNAPIKGKDMDKWSIHNSLSLAWRIGRAVNITRQNIEIDKLPENIIESFGGPECGKLIFEGKIIGVKRKLFKGHVYGEVIIEDLQDKSKIMKIPFKNENILASVYDLNKIKDKELSNISDDDLGEVVCSVPDLITVNDADTGEAIGTPEYRYGLIVFVLALSPDKKWIASEKAMKIGGPKAFGLDNLEYKPIGVHKKPISVIEEYAMK